MKWLSGLIRKKEFIYDRVRASDAQEMARLHSEGFHRAWSDGAFRTFLNEPNIIGFMARPVGKGQKSSGFVLARFVAGEAEILTITVDKSERRHGIGRQLMETVLRQLHQLRAESLFLEVDAQNVGAIGLYKRLGFLEVARRAAYYDTPTGKSAALVMRRDLK